MGNIGDKDRYPQDGDVTRGDYLIGTDEYKGGTKTFTVESLQGFTSDTLKYQEVQAKITGNSLSSGCNYIIVDAGIDSKTIVVQALSSNSIHQVCRVLADAENLYSYNISTNTLSLYTNAGGGGESNTASSSGGGAELTLPKNGVDLPFRTLGSDTLSVSQEDEIIKIEGASVAQGVKAENSIQPNDNISELNNNVNFVTQFNIDESIAEKANRDGDALTNATVNGVELINLGNEDLFLDAQGNYTVPAGAGENNTARTDGTGVAITKTKEGAVLPFKSLKSLGAQISSTVDDITINAASPSQGVKADTALQPLDNISELTDNVGYGLKDGETFTNATVNGVGLVDDEVATKFLNGAGNYTVPDSSGVGESNTSSNSGVGEGLALPKSGVDLPFKTIKASGGASISSDADSVTVIVNSSQYASAAQGLTADSAVQPADLASVATSGSYTDLSDKPVIPPEAPIDSVNGQTGVVVIEGNDLDWNGTSGVTVKAKFDSTVQSSDIGTTVQAHSAVLDATTASYTTAAEGQIISNGVDIGELDTNKLDSVTTGEPTGSDSLGNAVSLTQAEYDAGTPVATTFYIIT